MFGSNVDFAAELRKKEAEEQAKKGDRAAREKDFIPFYNLKENDINANSMRIRLLPTYEGSRNVWESYHIHSPIRGSNMKSINCSYKSTGESCPICQFGYNQYKAGDRQTSSKFRNKQRWLAQAVVVQSPVEIPMSDDGNPIKKIYLPSKVVEIIKEALLNGQVTDITACDFVIKKTLNQGGQPAYDKSFFDFQTLNTPMPDHVMEQLNTPAAKLHDLREDVPQPTTAAECGEWLTQALNAMNTPSMPQVAANGGAMYPGYVPGAVPAAPGQGVAPTMTPGAVPAAPGQGVAPEAPAPDSQAPQSGSLLDQLRSRQRS